MRGHTAEMAELGDEMSELRAELHSLGRAIDDFGRKAIVASVIHNVILAGVMAWIAGIF